jgi:hypothetical protein
MPGRCLNMFGLGITSRSPAISRVFSTFSPLLTIFYCYEYRAESPPNPPQSPVSSAHYWKSKCWENINSPARLRHYPESRDLQRRSIGSSQPGTYVLVLSGTFGLTIYLGSTQPYSGGWTGLFLLLEADHEDFVYAAWRAQHRARTHIFKS